MRKRILSTILAAAMVLSVMTAPAFAADGTLKAGDSITVEHAGDGSKHVFTYQSAKGINVFEISDSTPSERDYPFGYIDFADRYCMNSVIYNGKQVQFYQFDDEATHEMTWLTFGGDEGFVAAETYTISTSALEESGSYVLECGENQFCLRLKKPLPIWHRQADFLMTTTLGYWKKANSICLRSITQKQSQALLNSTRN